VLILASKRAVDVAACMVVSSFLKGYGNMPYMATTLRQNLRHRRGHAA